MSKFFRVIPLWRTKLSDETVETIHHLLPEGWKVPRVIYTYFE
jgi:hypothetical protein